jgi:hypothetical protein
MSDQSFPLHPSERVSDRRAADERLRAAVEAERATTMKLLQAAVRAQLNAVEAERQRCVKLVEAAGKKMWSTGYSREHAELVDAIRTGRL